MDRFDFSLTSSQNGRNLSVWPFMMKTDFGEWVRFADVEPGDASLKALLDQAREAQLHAERRADEAESALLAEQANHARAVGYADLLAEDNRRLRARLGAATAERDAALG